MRPWLLSMAIVIPFGVFFAQGHSKESQGIGDGGPASNATLLGPTGLTVDKNNLYIVEGWRVRRVDLKTGVITTVAGGGTQCLEWETTETTAPPPGCLGGPERVAVDSDGRVFVTDKWPPRVIKLGAKSDTFSTVVGENPNLSSDSGRTESAKVRWPAGIAIDPSGGLFFVSHTGHSVYRFSLRDRLLETIAGTGSEGFEGDGGPAKKAEFRFPEGLARDKKGNLFIADSGNCRIQRIDARTGIATTLTGTEKGGSTCEGREEGWEGLDLPTDVTVDESGNVFFVLPYRCRVQRFDAMTGAITTVAGNGESGLSGDGGPATEARLHIPEGIALDRSGNLYISDTQNNRVRRVNLKTGIITTIAGNGPVSPDLIL
jgi:DNA-binding beta-propeller fold protein YncE